MGWIQSISGKRVDVLQPDYRQIDIADIAHSLSMLCRFNGHGLKFYSVAEHCVHVSHEIAPDLALVGLLHDAAEAYIGDIPSPLKRHLPDFKAYETKMEAAIGEAFSIPPQLFHIAELKRADLQILADEKAALMTPEPEPWSSPIPSSKDHTRICAWAPERARQEFLDRFKTLTLAIAGAPE